MAETLKCPNCLDEKMVKVAHGLGALTCPSCDYIHVDRPKAVTLSDDPENYIVDV